MKLRFLILTFLICYSITNLFSQAKINNCSIIRIDSTSIKNYYLIAFKIGNKKNAARGIIFSEKTIPIFQDKEKLILNSIYKLTLIKLDTIKNAVEGQEIMKGCYSKGNKYFVKGKVVFDFQTMTGEAFKTEDIVGMYYINNKN